MSQASAQRYAKLCKEMYSFYNKEEVKAIAKELGIGVNNKLKDQLCREIVKRAKGVEGVDASFLRDPIDQLETHRENELVLIMDRFRKFENSFYNIFYTLANTHGVFVLDDSESYPYLKISVQFNGARKPVDVKVIGYGIGGRGRVALVGPSAVLDPLREGLVNQGLLRDLSTYDGRLSMVSHLLSENVIMAILLELMTLPGFVEITGLQFCYHLEGVRSGYLRPVGFERNDRPYVDHCVDVLPALKERFFAPSAEVWEEAKSSAERLPAEWDQFDRSVLDFYRVKVPFERMAGSQKQINLITQLYRGYQQAIQQFNQANAEQLPAAQNPNDLAITRLAGRIIHTPGVLDSVAKRNMEMTPLRARNSYVELYNEGRFLELLQEIADLLKESSAKV